MTSNASAPMDHHFHNEDLPSLLFRIIPVVLYSGSNKVATYAFLDEGSNISMIERQLAAKLDVTGYRQPLCLKWTGNVTREENDSHRIVVEISGTDQRAPKYIMSDVRTVDSLDLPKQSLSIKKLAERFKHLRNLSIKEYYDVTPQLFIGADNLKLAVPLKVREGLLWKYDDFEFSDSYPMAVERLQCLERRLAKDPMLKKNVQKQIYEYEQKGYAHRASPEELNSGDLRRVWYLPLGAVTNPRKPGKIRLIWDASAKVDGVSLNSMLLKGPDQMTLLPAVLFRFRQKPVAVSADIKEMFHQVRIRPEDRHSQRFVYRTDPTSPPETYLMNVATFGSTCSPATAQFVKNKNANQFIHEYPRAVQGIIHNHYTNSRNGCSAFTGILKPTNFDSTRHCRKILPIYEPTKRQLARCVMPFFDPQGFLAPYLIFGKVLLQDTWRDGTGWDQQICDGTFKRWKEWISMLDNINHVSIPRCYFSKGDLSTLEMHTFVDASETAYSCVSYFRIANPYGIAEVAFVAAKTKVAPLKPTTIPRLELMACVLGVRLAKYVVDGHSLAVQEHFFWSDSEVAMSWINADPRKYRPFVAFRVGEILEKSNREEWRWISSKLNPADEATKWGSGPYFDKGSIWYSGPVEFLRYPAPRWPPRKTCEVVTDEIRACYAHHESQTPVQLLNVEKFSSWKKMLRVMAYVCRFVDNCRTPAMGRRNGHLTQLEFQKAEECLFRAVQWESYTDEMATLTSNQLLPVQDRQPLEKSSLLYKTSPMLDTAGILRVDGRIGAVQNVPHDMKFPIILPKGHRLTLLVLDDLHRKLLHANNETVVNEARQRYYIAQLRTQVRYW
ncbi:uncharacterized protein LOC134207165 [Armigeres subalbatus]|uniref:uncharacterized protein LOC134207165 n=1 Tax=Armigeres subalbatus TaxID=124917 RepID=UPI002ED02B54